MDGAILTRSWVRVALIALGGVGGGAAFLFLPEAMIAAAAKTAAVFLGTVWVTIMAFALKMADVTEAPGLSQSEHEHLEFKVRGAVRRVWIYAGANALAALFILLPSIIIDAKGVLSAWMPILAGAGVGFSIYSIIAHAWWQEELRRFRSTLRERERAEQAAERLASKLASGVPLTPEEKAEIAKHNSRIDWPAPPTAH
jgi:drug/metabolite transporter (DMT)-like permease